MRLAFTEIRRAPVRYLLLVAAVALLMFLILFQQALQDGLVTAFVGAVRNQSAPVLVYSVDAQRTLQASVIPPPLEAELRAVDGVGDVARVDQGTFTVEVDGELRDATILGTDNAEIFHPTELVEGREPETAGEAIGSSVDFAVGDEVEIVPFGDAEATTITVVGLARDVQLNVTPTLFTDSETFAEADRAANPDVAVVLPNALAVVPASGVSAEDVVDAIDAAVPDAEALTRTEAADTAPGVAQVRQSFQIIFALYVLVIPLVTGLFFLIITLQKADALTLLRAIGAPASTLVRTLLLQVGAVLVLGLLVGTLLYAPLSQMQVGGLKLQFDAGSVLAWAVLIAVLGLLSVFAAMRRVLRIDPVEATIGPGVR